MKTSTIILISLFSVIGIFLLSLLIQVESKKINPLSMMEQMSKETATLPKFSHLKVGRGCNLSYIQSNGDSIHFGYPPEAKIERPFFSVQGDTLFVKNSQQINFYFLEVYASQLKSVTVDSAIFEIKEAIVPTFHINAKTSTINLTNRALVDTAYLRLTDCTLVGTRAKIKKLALDMERTEIRFDR